jgi:hypothetical protein
MKTKKALLYALALIGGCLPTSIHRLYTDKDVVFDPNLIGAWCEMPDANDSPVWEFLASGDPNAYEMFYTEKEGDSAKFLAHLVKLDDKLFLDVFPTEPNTQMNCYGILHYIPVHTFIKIEQIRPTLQMRMMNPDKLKELLESNPDLLSYEIADDERLVLSAPTEELQAFMRDYADANGIFGDASTMFPMQDEQ